MANDETRPESSPAEEPSVAAAFGPRFYLGQLRAFARERCPDPGEALPSVELHLATGTSLELCHVMGLAPTFVALAVHDGPSDPGGRARMRTELVPYALITRITIRANRATDAHVGFDLQHAPAVLAHEASPEEVLRAAALMRDQT